MNDKELFLMLLENKDKYKVFIDNDMVYMNTQEELDKLENNYLYEPMGEEFEHFGYELLNEIFQALGIDSEFV